MFKNKLLPFLLFLSSIFFGSHSATSQITYYWVGGTGNWTDVSHWSLTSGGAGGTVVPGTLDNAIFDGASGAAGYVVTGTIMDTIATLNASASAAFSLDVNLTVTSGFTGSTVAATFGSAGKQLIVNHGLGVFNFNPGLFDFSSDIKITSGIGMVNVTASILSSDSLILENGTINFSTGTTHTANYVVSTKPAGADNRNFNFNTSRFIVRKNSWYFRSYAIANDRPQYVEFNETSTNSLFQDSVNITSYSYDTLIVPQCSQLSIPKRIGIKYINTLSDSIFLGANEGLGYSSIVSGGLSCTNLLYITSNSTTINAPFRFNGPGTTSTLAYCRFNRLSAQNTPTITYTGLHSLQTNSTGFSLGNTRKFYWIGDGGNWSDPNHWSETSGGTPACFYPKYNDTLIFDNNSFSMSNQVVNLDTNFVVGSMLWTGIPTGSGTQFLLKDSLDMTGDLTMDQDVFVNSLFNTVTFQYPLIYFKKSSLVNLNNCIFNANAVIKTPQTDTVQFVNHFVTTDTMSLYLHSGSLKTNNYKLHTQALISFEATQKKTLKLGSSLVELIDGWNTDTLDFYLDVNPGTSNIHVGKSPASNYFIAKNQVFNDVIFDFIPSDTAYVKYSNTLKSLTIKGGSTIQFNAGDQYILDTLIIDGGCDKFIIDTVLSTVYQADTTIDVSVFDTIVYNDSTNVLSEVIYGVYILNPAVSFNDTTFIFGHKSTPTNADTIFLVDTLITSHTYPNIPLYDTTGIAPNYWYHYNDTLFRYTRVVHYMLDSIGTTPLVSYGVDTSANGNQAVDLFTSTGGTAFTFNTTNPQEIYGVKMKDIHLTGNTGTVYFGTSISNNTGWSFDNAPATVANFTTNNAYCYGDTVLFTNTSTSFSGNVNDLIYVWNYDETQHLGDTNAYVFQQADTHFVSLTTYYTNSCSSKKIDTIFINKPVVSLNMSEVDSIICIGTAVHFTASAADTNMLFQFYQNGTNLGAYTSADSIIIDTSGLVFGSYSLIINNLADNDTISVSGQLNGCYTVDNQRFIFDVKPLPTISIFSNDPNDSICIGDTVIFNATGGTSYRFYKNFAALNSFSAYDTLIVPAMVDSDTIYVVGKDVNGCVNSSDTLVYDVAPLPVLTLGASATTICQSTPVTFNSSGVQTYNFYVNGVLASNGTSASYLTDSLVSGDEITVTGTSIYGCFNNADTAITIIVNNNPVTSLICDDSDSVICAGTPVNFYASGAGIYEFFLNGTSLGAPSGTNSITLDTLTNNEYVSVVGSFSGCNSNSDTIQFTVHNLPTTTLTSSDADNIICQNTSVTYTASGATNYQFLVNGSAVTTSSPTNTYTTSTLTNGAIVKVIGESNGCSVSDQISMTVNSVPNVNSICSDADRTICFGDPITFTGSGADLSYQISIDGALSAPQASGVFNPSLSVGSHPIFIIGNSSNGCSNSSPSVDTIVVNSIPTMTLASSDADNIICAGQSVTFTASGSNLYQFFINGVSQTSNSTTNTFTTSALTNTQTVTVKGTTLGCIGSSSPIPFTVNPIPSMTVTSTDADNVYCQGTSVVYTATGPNDFEFFIDGTSQGSPSPTNTMNTSGLSTGNHTLSIVGTTNGCSTTTNQNITVNPNPTVSMSSSDLDNTICAGESVTFTGSGATNYQFFENGSPVSSSTINPNYTTSAILNGNNYYVVGSTNAGCTGSSSIISFVVNTNPTMSLSSSDADNVICSGENVTFTASGATNYEFFVNGTSQGPASATNTLSTTGLTNNASVVVVGTSTGCSASSTAIVTNVNQIPVVSLTASNGTSLCSNQNAQVVAGGANTYQFAINGNPQGAFTTNSVFNTPIANSDVISVTGQLNGCTSTSTTTITYNVTTNPTLSVTVSDVDQIICKNDPVTFTSTGAGTYTYTLNGIPVQTGANGVYFNGTLDQNDVIQIIGYNANCPSTPQSYTFTVNTMNLAISAIPSEIVCEGSSIQLNASGGDLYEFFINGNSQGPASSVASITHNNTQAGDYISFTATNNTTGCVQTLGYDFYPTVVSGVQIASLSSTSFCNGDSVTLVSNFPYGNQWYLDGNIIPGAIDTSYVATLPGIYTVAHTAGGSGEIWSKGYNGSGTIGNSANIDSPTPLQATGLTGITQISAGYDFALALDNTGNVYAWGENGSGQLGNGTFTTTNAPAQIASLSNIQQIATTSSSCAALTSSGTLYVWGNNNFGQLGIGSFAIINFPFQIPALTNVAEVVGGQDHFVIRKTDGTVWTVGKNTFGQLGHGNLTNTSTYTQVASLSGITKIGSGENHSFAINGSGDLYLWGNNINGQLGLGDNTNRLSPTLSNVKHVLQADGGAVHSLIVTANHEIMAMGDNSYGQLGDPIVVTQTNYPILVTTIDGVEKVSCGEYSSLALRIDNQVYGTGYNAENQLNAANGNVVSFTPINEVQGVNEIEAGKRTTHYLFSSAGSCTSGGTTVTVLTPAQPVITQSGVVLTSSPAVSYQWYLNGQAIPSGTQQTYTAIATGDYYVVTTDANGCTATSATVYCFVLGLEEAKSLTIQFYPNPTTGVFQIQFSETVESGVIQIVDMTGRIVQTAELYQASEVQMDLSNEANGTYMIRLNYEDFNTVVSRIVVAK